MGLARQWARNGVDIAGETGTSYVPKSTDVGKSLMTKIKAKTAPVCIDNPSITGIPQVGQTLTAKRGNWL